MAITGAYINRDDALALIVQERASEIIQGAVYKSVALSTLRTINIGTSIWEYPVLDSFPAATWLADEETVKPATEMTWDKKTVGVEEIAAIAVIHENVLDDASVNLETEVEGRVAEAIAIAIDKAVFFGTGAPASFPAGGLHGRAVAAGNTLANNDATGIVPAWSTAMGKVEDDGFDVTDGWAGRSLRPTLRSLTDDNGRPLYATSIREGGGPSDSLYGVPINYVGGGAWDATKSLGIVGDRSKAVILIRQDVTVKRLEEATITGIGNLAELDMIGIRVKARFGFHVFTPKTAGGPVDAFPFATITPDVTP